MQIIKYGTVIKLKAKEVFIANCQGKRFQDIEYSDEIISKIYGIHEDVVWNEIEKKANFYHQCLAEKNMREMGETVKGFFSSLGLKHSVTEVHAPKEAPSIMVSNETAGVQPFKG